MAKLKTNPFQRDRLVLHINGDPDIEKMVDRFHLLYILEKRWKSKSELMNFVMELGLNQIDELGLEGAAKKLEDKKEQTIKKPNIAAIE